MSVKRRWCARCKSEIPSERVEFLPETRLCLPCSEAVGSDFVLSFTQESLGKTNSLKKNYGGVSVKKRRRRIDPIV